MNLVSDLDPVKMETASQPPYSHKERTDRKEGRYSFRVLCTALRPNRSFCRRFFNHGWTPIDTDSEEVSATRGPLSVSIRIAIRKSIRSLRKSLERDRSPVAARGLRFDFGRSGRPAGGEGAADGDRPGTVRAPFRLRLCQAVPHP